MAVAADSPIAPPGMALIEEHLARIYPDQINPLQVASRLKFWLKGTEPLDYVAIYYSGAVSNSHPSHWHYVSFGLSDLHGDGRCHPPPATTSSCDNSKSAKSGLGLELTFRLATGGGTAPAPDSFPPPTWPAVLLQSVAKMAMFRDAGGVIHYDGSRLAPGNLVPLPSTTGCESRLIHDFLLSPDSQLKDINGPFGTVSFVQLVGVLPAELDAAKRWCTEGVVSLLRASETTGGSLLITDLSRTQHLFDIHPTARRTVLKGIEVDGSNLVGATGDCDWSVETDSADLKTCLAGSEIGCYTVSIGASMVDAYGDLAVKGRLSHGKPFCFVSQRTNRVVTFSVSPTEHHTKDPTDATARNGKVCVNKNCLDVYLNRDLFQELASALLADKSPLPVKEPLVLDWSKRCGVKVVVCTAVSDNPFLLTDTF